MPFRRLFILRAFTGLLVSLVFWLAEMLRDIGRANTMDARKFIVGFGFGATAPRCCLFFLFHFAYRLSEWPVVDMKHVSATAET
ncbi:MAG TPA: hypothetical protein DDW24_12160 [Blastocatellia bacterium]|nr:hypothetical protein [Blastocatellia bacterium]